MDRSFLLHWRRLNWRPSIKHSLVALFALLALVSIAQGLFGLSRLKSINIKTMAIVNGWIPLVDSSNRLNILINDVRSKQYRYLLSTDDVGFDEKNLAKGFADLAEAKKVYERFSTGLDEQKAYGAFLDKWEQYTKLWDLIPRLIKQRKRDEAVRLFENEMWVLSDEAGAAIDDVVRVERAGASAAGQETRIAYRDARLSSFVAFGGAVALALGAMAFSILRVALPLSSITAALSQLAKGDHQVPFRESDRRDEIGAMAKAFDLFRASSLRLEQALESARIAQDHAHVLARHDSLTGLPNRRVFAARLDDALVRARTGSASCAVMLIDLDRFKPVNDVYGHHAGDAVLCEIASRLTSVLPQDVCAARLGGDEFAVVFEEPFGTPGFAQILESAAVQLIAAIERPITVGASSLEIGASIGVSIWPVDDTDASTLLRYADLAMYRAKASATERICFFEQAMNEEIRNKTAIERDLRQAIAEGGIVPYYQPIVALADNRVRCFEILARWPHPTRGFIGPNVFIPLAEQLGLMETLTSSLLRQACLDAQTWPGSVSLALNVSATELRDPSLPLRLLSILIATEFAPSRLEIEVTETEFFDDFETVKAVLASLRQAGMALSLDNFGTGYSSLSHLRELSFDKIKIDRDFLHAPNDNNEGEKIVAGILNLAKSLNVATSAEGVEDEVTALGLSAGGCQFGQGRLFGAAVTAEKAKAMITLETRLEKAS